jgi:hypothetical protein
MKAFPIANMEGNEEFLGMDLRDYFAAKALPIIAKTYIQSWIENEAQDFVGFSEIEATCIAEGSYEMANAMMKARG